MQQTTQIKRINSEKNGSYMLRKDVRESLQNSRPKPGNATGVDGMNEILHVAEQFYSIQGEGKTSGVPSVFLRLQYCTLKCVWCDTVDIWMRGKPWTADDLLSYWKEQGWIDHFRNGAHLILTGGSPVNQQDGLIHLIQTFYRKFGFKPYIEIENECTRMPKPDLFLYVDQWNNSPKLENSGMDKKFRYHPEILKKISSRKNCWFKFVMTDPKEWDEIVKDFISPGLIKKEQIFLMPECSDRKEMSRNSCKVADLCLKEGVMFTSRLQISVWNKTTGV